jgi:hypothetical protein
LEVGGDGCVEIDALFLGLQRDDERIADGQIESILAPVPLPPAADRVDAYDAAGSEVLPRPFPYVLVERA